ncbi:MAG: hypothetical protein HQK84_08440, partial [Nitrospinae bacterium]|nr:hypothetical protein [Nitrospinota bacterium]
MEKTSEKLEQDNQNLKEQIKHLLKAKHDLALMQSKAEDQLTLYQELYETGSKITSTFSLDEVNAAILNFVIYKLNLERCIIYLKNEESSFFNNVAMEGYYDTEVKESVENISIQIDQLKLGNEASLPNFILSSMGEYSTCVDFVNQHFFIHEWAFFPFMNEKKEVIGFLIAGNSQENAEYYSSVAKDSEIFIGLANVASLTNTAINNINSYVALHKEGELLETRVQKRTEELNKELLSKKE